MKAFEGAIFFKVPGVCWFIIGPILVSVLNLFTWNISLLFKLAYRGCFICFILFDGVVFISPYS